MASSSMWNRRTIEADGLTVMRWKCGLKEITPAPIESPRFEFCDQTWYVTVETKTGAKAITVNLLQEGENSTWDAVDLHVRLINMEAAQSISSKYKFGGTSSVTLGNMEKIRNPSSGFVTFDGCTPSLTFEIFVRCPPAATAKREAVSCYRGIRNQGAWDYLIVLIQLLFHLPHFRKAVYNTETDPTDKHSIISALQNLFSDLQIGEAPARLEGLAKAFGWGDSEQFVQHDVQELTRVLFDVLEKLWNGTAHEKFLSTSFGGSLKSYIRCVNVDFESSRSEQFYDLTLVVKGCTDVYESFKEFTRPEMMDGDNAYLAEGHGKQDALKGIQLCNVPPVLHLHLQRFEFDFITFTTVKVGDYWKFYDEIDLTPFLNNSTPPSESEESSQQPQETTDNIWKLHSVVVHRGSSTGGAYSAYICPDGVNWFYFCDEQVTKATAAEAIDNNWGVDPDKFWCSTNSNPFPCVLVYVQKSQWSTIVDTVPDTAVPTRS